VVGDLIGSGEAQERSSARRRTSRRAFKASPSRGDCAARQRYSKGGKKQQW
jgi:hypothetical protein